MELTSFALGMLTMVGLIFIALIVVGMVKVLQTQKRLSMVEKFVESQNEEHRTNLRMEVSQLHSEIREVFRTIEKCEQNSCSYADSRIDKLLSKKQEILND
jgi:cell division protein FtsL